MIRNIRMSAILVALLMVVSLVQGTGGEQHQAQKESKPPQELRTDGWAWTKSHSQIQNPATILGGPLEVKADQEGMVFWIFPGPRKLDPHVFGTPDKPLGYAPAPYPLYGVPIDLRGVNEDGTRFTQTKEPASFSDKWTSMHGGRVRMTVTDVTATDAAKSQDEVDFEMSFPSPEGDHSYTVRVKKVIPHGIAYPFFGGVVTNTLLHGFTGVGTPQMPTEFTYVAFWGIGTIERDGQIVNENQLVHMMVTEPVRGENYRLVMDPEVPAQTEQPSAKLLHLIVPPFRVEPGAQEPLKKQPVKTGVMVEGPQGQMEQPLLHVMIHDIQLEAQRLAEASTEPAQQEQAQAQSSHNSHGEDQAAGSGEKEQTQQGEVAGGGQAAEEGQPNTAGAMIFSSNCAPCHGTQGEGAIGPALAGNENLQDVDLMVQQILTGGGGMPPFADVLTAEQVAAVATHERTSWGNEFGEVSVERVRQIEARPEREGGPLQSRAGPQEGWYTAEQASAGAAWFQEHCSRCHGTNLAGVARNPGLLGDHFLEEFDNVLMLFDFVSKNMPFDKPGELNAQTYIDIVAYILQQNGFPTGPNALAPKKEQLKQLQITREMAGITLIPDPDDPEDVDEPEKLNPFTGDQEAIADGKELFTAYKCAACHGAEGGGAIGPDLTDAYWIYGAHDGTLFDVITSGRDGMPPFENLADAEVWKIVAFIRSLYRGPETAIKW